MIVQVRSLHLTVGAEPVPAGPVLIQASGHQHAAKGTVRAVDPDPACQVNPDPDPAFK